MFLHLLLHCSVNAALRKQLFLVLPCENLPFVERKMQVTAYNMKETIKFVNKNTL